MAHREPVSVGPLVEACLDRAAGKPGASAIWRVWDDAVGPQIARRAQPVRLRGDTLVVAVSSAPWMQELHLLKPAIRAELNARLPRPLVGDVYLVLTEGRETVGEAAAPSRPRRRCPDPPPPSDLPTLPEPLRHGFAGLLAAWRRRAGT